jgi:ADP-ribosylglycohydrolase
MQPTEDQYLGCVLGLAMGDTLGAPYEGGIVERLVWHIVGRTKQGRPRWTDDTQMALDLSETLLARGDVDQNDLAQRFAQNYRWDRGYGPSTARLLKRIRRGQDWRSASAAVRKGGSFGNGAAMRAPIIALYFHEDLAILLNKARAAAEVTHTHPIGIDGATAIAVATRELLRRTSAMQVVQTVYSHATTPELADRLKLVVNWLMNPIPMSARQVVADLGNGMTAHHSVPTALYIALGHLHKGFDEMMDFTIACGGDVDTIGAMAGALWGASNGRGDLPNIALEDRDALENVARRLFASVNKSLT